MSKIKKFKMGNREMPKITANKKYIQEIDLDLLCNLFDFQTPSRDKKAQNSFLNWIKREFIEKNNIECSISYDSYGGMYITKGKSDVYPCVVSHIDTVHSFDPNFKSYVCDDYVIGLSNGKQCGLGADPKAGLYILLQMLLICDTIKCVLFLDEEQGCLNSNVAKMGFFKDCAYVMQFDRRSFTTDVIEYTNGTQVLGKAFKELLLPIMTEFSYTFNNGTCTDVGTLTRNGIGINTFNISNGSFNEHMKDECCGLQHTLNALNFGLDVITNIENKRYTFIPFKDVVIKPILKPVVELAKRIHDNWTAWEPTDVKQGTLNYEGSNDSLIVEADRNSVELLLRGECEYCMANNSIMDVDTDEKYCTHCGLTYIIPQKYLNY